MIARITPATLGGTIPAIASKSDAHRLLILAALSQGETRLIMEQRIQRMIQHLFLAAVFRIAIHAERQTRNGFCQDADAGIHSSHLHGGLLVNRPAC